MPRDDHSPKPTASANADALAPDTLSPDTLALHADDGLEAAPDVAPPLHLSTTYTAGNAEGMVYNRDHNATRQRLEAVLGALEGGHAVTYPSGQAATYAALLHLAPKRVLIDRGYHGTHQVLKLMARSGLQVLPLEAAPAAGDVIWLETPKNPACEIEDIAAHAARARAAGAYCVVDSTFATPVLQHPLALGAHLVMHSSTKFLAGHSDAQGGVLVTTTQEDAAALKAERSTTGAVPGALEVWLTLRGIRTLALRVERQSATATTLAAWLAERVPVVWHPSLPSHPGHALAKEQMRGPGGVLSFEVASGAAAQALPAALRIIHGATSLGGVESLIEWRRQYDDAVPEGLLRFAVGLEAPADLIADLEQGLRAVGA